MTIRIGLTGPIGCGKSTVARWLAERPGIVVIDADREAREVLEPGTPEVEAVYAQFGEALRGSDGRLDRAALGRIVFGEPTALRDLEAIVHPAVRPRILAAMDEAAATGADAVVVEAIKLVEGGLAALCDEVWLMTCEPATQRKRLVGRGTDPGDAETRIRAQGDIAGQLRPQATSVIRADGEPEATRAEVERLLDVSIARQRTGTGRPSPGTR